jgi:hypothetical protein
MESANRRKKAAHIHQKSKLSFSPYEYWQSVMLTEVTLKVSKMSQPQLCSDILGLLGKGIQQKPRT